jgi:hypothetical protein
MALVQESTVDIYDIVPASRMGDVGGVIPNRRLRKLSIEYFHVLMRYSHPTLKRHHKEDVIVGSIIGTVSSTICYLIYWPNPFSWRSFRNGRIGKPRLLYSDREDRPRVGDFELTSLDDDEPV